MDEIFLIIEKIGDIESVVDKAYWYYGEASLRAQELTKKTHDRGYADFTFHVKTLEISGLR